jgi:hypothetical protein
MVKNGYGKLPLMLAQYSTQMTYAAPTVAERKNAMDVEVGGWYLGSKAKKSGM